MLTYLLRNVVIYAKSRFRPRLGIYDESELALWVRPFDLDYNMHQNNARYVEALEMGRLDLFERTNMLAFAQKKGFFPLVASLNVVYTASLPPFARYTVKTRLGGWDERWVYVVQHVVHKDKLCAQALVKGIFRTSKGKTMSPCDVLKEYGADTHEPLIPEYIAHQRNGEETFRKATKAALPNATSHRHHTGVSTPHTHAPRVPPPTMSV